MSQPWEYQLRFELSPELAQLASAGAHQGCSVP